VDPSVELEKVILPRRSPPLADPSNKSLATFPVRVARIPIARSSSRASSQCCPASTTCSSTPRLDGAHHHQRLPRRQRWCVPVALTYLAWTAAPRSWPPSTHARRAPAHELAVTMVVPRSTGARPSPTRSCPSSQLLPGHAVQDRARLQREDRRGQSHGRTIWEYAPASRGAEMLEAIAKELVRRGEKARAAASA